MHGNEAQYHGKDGCFPLHCGQMVGEKRLQRFRLCIFFNELSEMGRI